MLGKGKATETNKYNYLGNWITWEGNVKRQIEEVENKMKGIAVEMNQLASDERFGQYSTEARLLMYKRQLYQLQHIT